MNKINAFIFDMDGVLLDSERLSDYTWKMASEELNLPLEKITPLINSCRGANKNDSIQIMKNGLGADFDSELFFKTTSKYFSKAESDGKLKLLPYAKEILEYLKPKYKIALASSTKKESVYRQMTNLGLIGYFEKIICGDMVTHSKPDPQIYLTACEEIGEKPENCVCVEDSFNGIKSGKAAGLTTIMIPDILKPTEEIKKLCDFIVENLKEIEKIF